MSKRKPKNRPRKRPSHKPRHKKVSKKPEVKPSLISRRTMLAVLLGLGTGSALKFRSDFGNIFYKKETKKPVHRKVPQKRPVAPKLPEYDEWASKIELPVFEYKEESQAWDKERISNYLLPKEIKKEYLASFYNNFDKYKAEFLTDWKKVSSIKEKKELILRFISTVIAINFRHNKSVRMLHFTPSDMPFIVREINRLLIPHNVFLDFSHDTNEGPGLIIYEVDNAQSSEISLDAKKIQLPIVNLKNKQVLLDTSSWDAKFIPVGNYIVTDKAAIIAKRKYELDELKLFLEKHGLKTQKINRESVIQNYLKSVIYHELAHAVFHNFYGIVPGKPLKKLREGPINMKNYQLGNDAFRGVTSKQLHELFANGCAYIMAKDAVKMAILDTTVADDPTYQFTGGILLSEIYHSPPIEENIGRQAAQLYQMTTRDAIMRKMMLTTKTVFRIPDEELHRIGERMAKLAIYLTQKE